MVMQSKAAVAEDAVLSQVSNTARSVGKRSGREMVIPNKQNLASRTKDLFSTILIVTMILYISIKLFLKASFEEKCYICNPDGVFANYGLTCLYHTLMGSGGGNKNDKR